VLCDLAGCLEPVRQRRSHFAQRLNVPKRTPSPLCSLRPCWTAFLSILRLFGPQHHTQDFNSVFCINRVFPQSARSLSDIDRSPVANDLRPAASFSARINPQRIPANTPPVFPGLRPPIWPYLRRLVTKAISDRLLGHGRNRKGNVCKEPLRKNALPILWLRARGWT
jgi:hypothetical protein